MDENSKSVEKNCSKMGKHILLIENVYESVRKPLTYIKNNITIKLNTSADIAIRTKNQSVCSMYRSVFICIFATCYLLASVGISCQPLRFEN